MTSELCPTTHDEPTEALPGLRLCRACARQVLAPGLRTDPPEGDRLRTGAKARKIASTRIHVHNPVDEHFDDAYWTACDEANARANHRFPTWWVGSGRTIA